MEYFGLCSRLTTMADTTVPATSNGKTVLSTEETVANGDVVTTITKTKTVRIEKLKFVLNFIS
jgi:hypothetical protein